MTMVSCDATEKAPPIPLAKSSMQSKLEQLRARRVKLEESNRKALFSDHRRQNLLRQKIKSEADSATLLEPKEAETPETKASRNLSYSLQECEDWQMRKPSNRSAQNHDYNSLAATSYHKELSESDIDPEAYELAKRKLSAAGSSSGSPESPQDFNIITSQIDKQALADALRESVNRKLKKQRRRGVGIDAGSFINEKNKQFNMKVNREYD